MRYFALIIALLASISLTNCSAQQRSPAQSQQTASNKPDIDLNRNPTSIHYSKHARCRMDCRHISESEVREILSKGTVNYRKSDLQADACSKRYAVEGRTHDNQQVRIIFAPCKDIETVVTVIDLGRDWSCDCK